MPDADWQRPQHAPQHASWQLLGSARMTGRMTTLDVSNNQRFHKLELRASRFSSMDIRRVLITFVNGETQSIRVNDKLYAGKPIVLDLEGRRGKKIDKVTVVGRSDYGGRLSVFAI
jgi:hypothetical protein